MEKSENTGRVPHRGRIGQILIYLGKFFRMFIFMDDWKVLPMAALIAGLVAFVAGRDMFSTMEGTLKGALALSCICVWNGFFNSIQVVCRERDIVKREHRSGMHISSYIAAHMIYQAFLCLLQTCITVMVCIYAGMQLPHEGYMTPWFYLDFGITVFLLTYAADMTSLMFSCIVRTTTAAMTIMPFALIFELLFSGAMFGADGGMKLVTNLSLAKWGIDCFCAQADYNSQRMVTVWNQMFKFRDVEFQGEKPIKYLVEYMEQNDLVDSFEYSVGQNSQNVEYMMSKANIANCWGMMILFALICAVIAILCLKRIDRDKR